MRLYPWLRSHFEQLIIGYQSGRRHHALLIQTLLGMGDDELIYAITRFLMCQKPEGHKSCGKCRSCKLMKAGTHPDYYILEPKNDKSTLGIDIVRNIIEKLYEHAHLYDVKVVWINDIMLLTESAVNALLKILEEPPEKTWFFFSCYEPWQLLATLRSRCCLHRLTVPQERWTLVWLQQEASVPQDMALAALRLCNGAPVAALELLQKNYWTQRTKLCSLLSNVLDSHDWLSLLTILNHEQVSVHLQWLSTLFLDAMKLQQGATVITNVDAWPLINNLTISLTNDTLYAIVHALCQCRKQLLTITGLNRELVLVDYLLMIEYYLQPDTVLPTSYF